ncbi:hypothetical protein F5B21DRAFT_503950 [Xylaria acuta]|nr:hypothetical protein F5B21DRAFT_503950 [Xylaria acuta]
MARSTPGRSPAGSKPVQLVIRLPSRLYMQYSAWEMPSGTIHAVDYDTDAGYQVLVNEASDHNQKADTDYAGAVYTGATYAGIVYVAGAVFIEDVYVQDTYVADLYVGVTQRYGLTNGA